jgi:hypothetical protein
MIPKKKPAGASSGLKTVKISDLREFNSLALSPT